MERLLLQDRVIALVSNAERLSAKIDKLKKPDTANIAFMLLPQWEEVAREAIHFCRLAVLSLPDNELENLIARVRALDPDPDVDLWESYTLAEWFNDANNMPDL